jgi:hypothetical protein
MEEPELHFLIQPHILIRNVEGYKAAPKGVYKLWRNDKFRDKLRATMLHLSEDQDAIICDVGSEEVLKILRDSIKYLSPCSYEEPAEQFEISELDIDD